MQLNQVLQALLQLNNFLLLVRIGLVVLLYFVVLQVVGVARRDMRQMAVAGRAAGVGASGRPIVGHLVVIQSGSTPLIPGATLDLEAVTVLGRAPTSTIPLESNYVSVDHTRVFFKNRSLWVEDLNSKNGTYLNSQQITKPVAVRPGDILQVGDVRFKFAV